jgi:hypothetical protein
MVQSALGGGNLKFLQNKIGVAMALAKAEA